jgi:hypothetical protein
MPGIVSLDHPWSLSTYSLRKHMLHPAPRIRPCCFRNLGSFRAIPSLVQCICVFERRLLLQPLLMLEHIQRVFVAV